MLPRAAVWVERDIYSPLGMGLLLVCQAATCAMVALHPAFAALGMLTPLLVYGWWVTPRSDWARVTVDAEGLRVEGERLGFAASRAEVAGAWMGEVQTLAPSRGAGGPGATSRLPEPAVVVELKGAQRVRFAVASEGEGARALLALGCDPGQRRVRFRGRRVFHSLIVWLVAPVLAVLGAMAVLPWVPAALRNAASPAVMVALFLGFRWALRPSLDVEVGADGLRVKTRFGSRRVAWSTLERVYYRDGVLHLVGRDGRHVKVWCNPDDSSVGPALARRAAEALERARAGGDAERLAGLLDRGEQTVSAWRARLATVLHRAGGYRAEALDARSLHAVVDDAAAPLARRIAASLALVSAAPDDAPARIRIVAERTVDPDERQLFEAAAGDRLDDAALEKLSRK